MASPGLKHFYFLSVLHPSPSCPKIPFSQDWATHATSPTQVPVTSEHEDSSVAPHQAMSLPAMAFHSPN